jgi:hypothetical protein
MHQNPESAKMEMHQSGCPICGGLNFTFENENGKLRYRCNSGHLYWVGIMENARFGSKLAKDIIAEHEDNPHNVSAYFHGNKLATSR